MSFNVLFESSSGYALFSVLESEEIGSLTDEVQAGMSDFSRFQRIVKLLAFHPFDTAENALENINAVTEHELTADLKVRCAICVISRLRWVHYLMIYYLFVDIP
jgi:nucleolar protein 56